MPGWKRPLRLALLLLAALLPIPLAAQPGGGYTGIDLVLAIDQSGSMWGYPPSHPEKNDKYNHRVGAAQEIVLRLLDDVWQSPTVHRFSVIDFGDIAEVTWSGQVLRYDPKDTGTLGRTIRSQLSRRIHGRTGDGWVNTNTPLAMEMGRQELAKMAGGEPRTGRRCIVLVITDGRANKPPADLRTLRDRVAVEAGRLKAEGTELWVIGLNDSDYYWLDGDGAFWASLTETGRARLADRVSTSLPIVVGKTIDEWLGRSGKALPDPKATAKDQYVCPPYLSRITFRATAGIPYGEVHILDPDGVEVPRTAGGPTSDPGTFSHFTADDPTPGIYKIQKSPDRSFVVTVEEIPPKLERLLPAGEADLGAETRIVFRATSAAGNPLEPLSKWPIRAMVRILAPSGPPLEFPAKSTGDGRFEATWKPASPGSYQAELHGFVHLADGSERDIFQSGPHAYPRELTVSRRRPFYLELETPRPDAGLRLNPWAKSARVELSLRDAEGHRVEKLGTRVKEPGTWLSVVPIDPSGVPLGAPVALVPDPDGIFVGQVPVMVDWKGSDGLTHFGSINLKLEAKPDRMSGDDSLRALRLPQSAEERRVGGDPFTVGPIDILAPYWLLGVGLFLGLCLLVALAWLIFRRLLPNAVIRRQDAARGGNVQIQIYDDFEGPNGIVAKALPVGGASFFKLDNQVSLPLGDQRLVAEHFRVTRLSSSRKPQARIEYRWRGKRETHTDLVSGSPKPLKGLPPEAGRLMVMLSESN